MAAGFVGVVDPGAIGGAFLAGAVAGSVVLPKNVVVEAADARKRAYSA